MIRMVCSSADGFWQAAASVFSLSKTKNSAPRLTIDMEGRATKNDRTALYYYFRSATVVLVRAPQNFGAP